MSQNNSTTDISCPGWYVNAGETASLIVHSIFSPFYILLGLFGHGLCLKAFHTKSKQESAYMYQIFTTVSETLEVFAWGLYVFIIKLLSGDNQMLRVSCYSCMLLAAIMGPFLVKTCFMMSILFTLCMSADRVYALWKPTAYQKINAKRNHILAACFCVTVAILVSLYLCFIWRVGIVKNGTSDDPPLYQIEYAPPDNALNLIHTLNFLNNVMLALGLVLLCFTNVALLYFFRVRIVKGAHALNLTNQEKKRQEGERTLFLLTVCQWICMTLSITVFISFSIVTYFFPEFYICRQSFFVPMMDLFLQLADLSDLVLMLVINKQFRRMVGQELRCGDSSTVVQPIQIRPQRMANVRQEAA